MKLIRGRHFETFNFLETQSTPPRIEIRLKEQFFLEVPTFEHAEFVCRIKRECEKRNLEFKYEERGEERVIVLVGMKSVNFEKKNKSFNANLGMGKGFFAWMNDINHYKKHFSHIFKEV